jgi:hypothetical protein
MSIKTVKKIFNCKLQFNICIYCFIVICCYVIVVSGFEFRVPSSEFSIQIERCHCCRVIRDVVVLKNEIDVLHSLSTLKTMKPKTTSFPNFPIHSITHSLIPPLPSSYSVAKRTIHQFLHRNQFCRKS